MSPLTTEKEQVPGRMGTPMVMGFGQQRRSSLPNGEPMGLPQQPQQPQMADHYAPKTEFSQQPQPQQSQPQQPSPQPQQMADRYRPKTEPTPQMSSTAMTSSQQPMGARPTHPTPPRPMMAPPGVPRRQNRRSTPMGA